MARKFNDKDSWNKNFSAFKRAFVKEAEAVGIKKSHYYGAKKNFKGRTIAGSAYTSEGYNIEVGAVNPPTIHYYKSSDWLAWKKLREFTIPKLVKIEEILKRMEIKFTSRNDDEDGKPIVFQLDAEQFTPAKGGR